MNVDDIVRERIAAARRRIEQRKQLRAQLAEQRRRGLAARHRAKLTRPPFVGPADTTQEDQ
ncbi:hypothetical protein ACIO3O_19675 [Streptomyces sp. NPDC087440]|uniref:hypothetical protein n=1 Tax=Streptomyces sp. NPDC087440 TaxID=3365790 RepID=UPI00382440D1